jgi:CRISPR-associated exonuclease Cas4
VEKKLELRLTGLLHPVHRRRQIVRQSNAALFHYQVVADAWNELIGHIASSLVCILSLSLDLLLEGYQERKRAAAALDFDDLILHVRSLVRNHEEVRRAIGRRYKYILIDEFQDTDRVQTEILFSIAATADRSERWQDGRLRPGSLFLVGDPKQAIYRFRGADIEAYELSRRPSFFRKAPSASSILSASRTGDRLSPYLTQRSSSTTRDPGSYFKKIIASDKERASSSPMMDGRINF